MSGVREVNYTEATVRAGKRHRCDDFYGCVTRWIEKGDDHIRMVAFPGHDANSSARPWVMRICIPCWRRYDAEKPLPPRRSTAGATS